MADHLIHKSTRYVDEALWQRAAVHNTLHLDYDLAARVVSRKSLRIMRYGCSINGHILLRGAAELVECFKKGWLEMRPLP